MRFNARKRYWLFVLAIGALIFYGVTVKVIAANQLGYYVDEPDDIGNIVADLKTIPTFFSDTISPDQTRLSHIVAAPVVMLTQADSLVPTRILFILIHALYLLVVYKLFRLKLSPVRSYYGLALVALSAYLFSFSVFTMTTGNSLFLLCGTLLVYYYVRYFEKPLKEYSLDRLLLFGVIMGLAMSSRLFSGIILVSIFLYDAWIQRQTLREKGKTSLWSVQSERLNIVFTVVLVVINLAPLPLMVKTGACAVIALYYGVALLGDYLAARGKTIQIGFWQRWIFTVHTAFMVTLITSPIHLNIRNIIRIFNWSGTWHKPENFINPSRFDIFTITSYKIGLLAGLAIVLCLTVIAARRQMRTFLRTYALFIIIILLHFIFFVKIKYVLVWYPVFLVPFFYLPLMYVFPDKLSDYRKPVLVVLAVILLSIPIYEQWRYLRLFPYGHIDGAQQGQQYIGWNKPGAISFETMHIVVDYLDESQTSLPAGDINCSIVASPRYNKWAVELFNVTLEANNINTYRCRKGANQTTELAQYVLTSIYTPQATIDEVSQNYEKHKIFVTEGIPTTVFWVKR